MTTDASADEYMKISSEVIAASDAFDAVLRARGLAETDIPIIDSHDTEAIDAAKRLRAANLRLGAWLEANVTLD